LLAFSFVGGDEVWRLEGKGRRGGEMFAKTGSLSLVLALGLLSVNKGLFQVVLLMRVCFENSKI